MSTHSQVRCGGVVCLVSTDKCKYVNSNYHILAALFTLVTCNNNNSNDTRHPSPPSPAQDTNQSYYVLTTVVCNTLDNIALILHVDTNTTHIARKLLTLPALPFPFSPKTNQKVLLIQWQYCTSYRMIYLIYEVNCHFLFFYFIITSYYVFSLHKLQKF